MAFEFDPVFFLKNPVEFSEFLGGYELNDIQGDWINWLFSPNEKKTFRQLLAHRESGKTSAVAIGVARHILFNPNTTIGVIRSNKREGMNFLRLVKSIIESEKFRYLIFLFGLIPNTETRLWSVENLDSLHLSYRTTARFEGTIDAIGYEQSITGRHYQIIIFDDFVTIEDRLSRVIREKKYIYANEFLQNILSPGGLAINLGTFWHADDSNQRFKKAYIEDQEFVFEEKIFKKGEVFGEGEKEITAFRESKIKGMGLSMYSANYELTDKQDENLPFANLGQDVFRAEGAIYAVIDPAYGGGDRTAISIGTKQKGKYLIVGKIFKESIYDIIPLVSRLLNDYQVSEFWVETNADKGASFKQIADLVSGKGEGYTSTSNKQHRIMSNLKPRWGDVFFDFEKSDGDYLIEVREWSTISSRDDAPDSLAELLQRLDNSQGFVNPWLIG